jgi:hypothetical protein
MDEALALAQNELGNDLSVLVIPHALLTLPVVKKRATTAACAGSIPQAILLQSSRAKLQGPLQKPGVTIMDVFTKKLACCSPQIIIL